MTCPAGRTPAGDGPFYSELSIPKVKIGAYTFSVVFQMDGGDRLVQVLIAHHSEDEDREPVGAFGAAKSQLSERFGTPERKGTANEFHWSFPTTTISLANDSWEFFTLHGLYTVHSNSQS